DRLRCNLPLGPLYLAFHVALARLCTSSDRTCCLSSYTVTDRGGTNMTRMSKRRRMARAQQENLLAFEQLEQRLALTAGPFADGSITGPMALQPFANGLHYHAPAVRDAVARITTNAPDDVYASVGALATIPS